MTELEKVEKLREKADVSFAEAKEALDQAGGDVLDALIYLERQGKSTVPAGGGFFSGAGTEDTGKQTEHSDGSYAENGGETFKDTLKRFGKFCLRLIHKGNTNFLDATRRGKLVFSLPVTAVVVLIVFLFWLTIILFVLSLFFGVRYRFRGEDLGRESVNRVMDGAAGVVEDVKKSFNGNAESTGE
ncbi:MAG: DUF4342 domain-containing protein [Oscillospiraceae bacterium]|jgi:hypothetical protein|nr:DUF4342 domain-containing protein [Oscillospiraceae bacterium]